MVCSGGRDLFGSTHPRYRIVCPGLVIHYSGGDDGLVYVAPCIIVVLGVFFSMCCLLVHCMSFARDSVHGGFVSLFLYMSCSLSNRLLYLWCIWLCRLVYVVLCVYVCVFVSWGVA